MYETKKTQICWLTTHEVDTTKQTTPRPVASAAPHLITPAFVKIGKLLEGGEGVDSGNLS